MRKRWRDVLTLVSLIVWVASLSLVGRSFVWSDAVLIQLGENATGAVVIMDAQLALVRMPRDPSVREIQHLSGSRAAERPHEEPFWNVMTGSRWLGVGWGNYRETKLAVLPLWLVPIVTAIPPLLWWRKRRKEGGRGFAVNAAATVDNDSMIR